MVAQRMRNANAPRRRTSGQMQLSDDGGFVVTRLIATHEQCVTTVIPGRCTARCAQHRDVWACPAGGPYRRHTACAHDATKASQDTIVHVNGLSVVGLAPHAVNTPLHHRPWQRSSLLAPLQLPASETKETLSVVEQRPPHRRGVAGRCVCTYLYFGSKLPLNIQCYTQHFTSASEASNPIPNTHQHSTKAQDASRTSPDRGFPQHHKPHGRASSSTEGHDRGSGREVGAGQGTLTTSALRVCGPDGTSVGCSCVCGQMCGVRRPCTHAPPPQRSQLSGDFAWRCVARGRTHGCVRVPPAACYLPLLAHTHLYHCLQVLT